ncbi:MAG: HD domain-containing protein [Candidatus Dojkabacteria bacterium]
MKDTSDVTQVLDHIIRLYKGYSQEHRATTQPYHLHRLQSAFPRYTYNPDDTVIREPLIEHVGSLGIVASSVFPYLDDPEVDLGHTLALLAVHDIGELKTGDVITFTKTDDESSEEREGAFALLHPSLHVLYLEAEKNETKSARFAKSIDKITPDIIDLITPPEITMKRYKHFMDKEPGEIVPLIKKFKHPYMLWNTFLKELHLEILRRIALQLQG